MLRELADLVWPASCAGCGAPGADVCVTCAAVLAAPPTPVRPAPTPGGFPATYAVARYDGTVQSLLIAYKEHGRLALARPLGAALAAAALAAAASDHVTLVPIPSARRARRQRGFGHVERLAANAARLLRGAGVDTSVRQCLVHARTVADQSTLDSGARGANVQGAFAVRRTVDMPPTVVIVDDLVTTGATLTAATAALVAAGVHVTAAAIAATVRRVQPVRPGR